MHPIKLLSLEKQLAIYRRTPDDIPPRLRAKLRNHEAARKADLIAKQETRRLEHKARRPLTRVIVYTSSGRLFSDTRKNVVDSARIGTRTYNLPDTIKIGDQVFDLHWWMDPYSHAPDTITRKYAK